MNVMISEAFLIKLAAFACCFHRASQPCSGQTSLNLSEPTAQRPAVVLLPRPGDQECLDQAPNPQRRRFRSRGQGRSSALLGDILFPDPATREYFTEEMQGRLNVATDYDSITITMRAAPASLSE